MNQDAAIGADSIEEIGTIDIVPVAKDFLGGRVGIINKKGTDAILGVKNYLPLMAKNMPFNTTT